MSSLPGFRGDHTGSLAFCSNLVLSTCPSLLTGLCQRRPSRCSLPPVVTRTPLPDNVSGGKIRNSVRPPSTSQRGISRNLVWNLNPHPNPALVRSAPTPGCQHRPSRNLRLPPTPGYNEGKGYLSSTKIVSEEAG